MRAWAETAGSQIITREIPSIDGTERCQFDELGLGELAGCGLVVKRHSNLALGKPPLGVRHHVNELLVGPKQARTE